MNKSVLKLTIIGLITILFSGCASTGVIPLGQDSYLIGKKDGSPGVGVSFAVKAEVYQEANEFCSKKNLEVKTLEVNTIAAAPGRLGSTELRFKCIKSGSTSESFATDIKEIRYR